MLQILYLAQDLADPAVRRRTLTLVAGGARVTLAGFRRGDNPLAAIDGVEPIELGTTADGRFAQRIGAVARACLSLQRQLGHVRKPDVIIARNLEMLAVARRAVAFFGGTVPIVYECLDIHRLMLRKDIVGRMLRAAESQLGKDARLLITSSPAFIEHYFRPLSGIGAPPMLLENKVLEIDGTVERRTASPAESPPPGAPWKIGWFGALRCRRSLALLAEFSRKMEGRFEIVLRGRPAYSEFDDFDGFVRDEPFMRFEGAYRNPEDLAEIYGEVHFTWAIDYFEEGQNSAWLLPNRLYEGCRHGRIPIAMKGTETARFLSVRSIGLVLEGADVESLATVLGPLTPNCYADAAERISRCNPGSWVFDRTDCEALVRQLATLTLQAPQTVPVVAMAGSSHKEGGFL
ncbi:succinoglycan biosynthesis glycosyltransferase ExoL [Sinorhizobium meliloti]|uniref:Glucosyltransferase protein n=1 Tax=Sinorhizobium meliloti (strain SM11) TaxID=707241 RepID=F7XK22_SINMM|nr:succinoglycan biosynthesis glycosyltransferase ExoL [Sinorhizobium meliloti]AEH83350.1 putative glucosyltransferase protein [Sinorhizobium meliloti SM11]ASP55336.1 glycosyl transferase family 1 [Sinorhizobium meliloti]ASP68750.1 glycosyl transferase family 1 [Sinorhizobium meliloti]ASP82560.1 glycosyl transferase family 1 [Sinorhizobium meliloti]KKA13582.1 glycosyl transferase family 1 [Sinorhizobium meliloti]